jgi:hypothetical protein
VFVFSALAVEGNGNVNFPLGILQKGFLFGLILPRVEPLLYDDREIDEYTRPVSRQRLGKHVPAATNPRATTEVLFETGVFLRGAVSRSCLEGNWGDPLSSIRESVKRGLERVKLKNLQC